MCCGIKHGIIISLLNICALFAGSMVYVGIEGLCVCTFFQVGDVLLTYENEVILTNTHYGDKALPYVVPPCNVRIECPVSQVDEVRRLYVHT